MRYSRWMICILIFSLSMTGWVLAQESTEEPAPEVTTEATQEPAPEVTAEATQDIPAAPTPTEEPETDSEPVAGDGTYTVKAGDTLYRIAVNNGTTVAILAQLNNIANSALIYTGQVLTLPSDSDVIVVVTPVPTVEPETTAEPEATAEPDDGDTASSGEASTGGSYVIQPGDTLYRIAVTNNTTVATLQSLNNIANVNLIFAGQRLVLPGDDSSSGDSESTGANASTETGDAGSSARVDFGYGIQVYTNISNTPAVASQISQLGANWVKLDVSWADVEPLEGEFDYASLDAAVTAIDALGANILLNVYEAPAWTRTNYTLNQLLQLNSGPPEDFAKFGNFMTNIATRYSGVVDAYEIWKSPNLLKYWTVPVYANPPELQDNGDYGVPDEIQIGAIYYVDLLEVGYDAVNSVDDSALILTAGLAPVGSSDNYNFIATGTFLNNMLLRGAANYSDGIGAVFGASGVPPTAECCEQPPGVDSHYESFLQYFLEILEFYNDIMTRNDVADMPLFVTQVGWGTSEGSNLVAPPAGFEWLNYTSQDEQAIYITQAFEEAKSLDYVAGMFLYNLNGCSIGDVEACFFSLVDASGTARPAFNAYQGIEK
jgi:LysM repeat protein